MNPIHPISPSLYTHLLRSAPNPPAMYIKGEVSPNMPNNNVDCVSREQIYKPNNKSLSRFG